MPAPLPRWLTPPQIAQMLAVDVHGILAAIRAGRLVAIDVRRPGATRPRYRVSPEALDDYLRLLRVVPPPRRPARRPPITKKYV
jgi:hypothetical protein